MKITFKTEGGIAYLPGLSRPVVVDDEQLSEEARKRLGHLLEVTRFFDRPEVIGTPAPGAADYQQFVITIEDSGRRHSVRLIEPVADADLQDLLNYLREQSRTLRRQAADSHEGPAEPQ